MPFTTIKRKLAGIPWLRETKGHLSDWLRHRRLPNHKVVVPVYGSKLLVRNPRTSVIARSICLHGIYERQMTALIRSLVKPGMRIVDVGADVGYYAVQFAELTGTRGRVFAFEPTEDGRSFLNENVRINNYTQLTIHSEALSDRDGFVDFGASSVRSQMTPVNHGDQGEPDGHERAVAVPFDDWAASHEVAGIDLVKVDVEGAEMLVLLGMRTTLIDAKPILLVEVHPGMMPTFGSSPEQLGAYIRSLGYGPPSVIYGRIGDDPTETHQLIWLPENNDDRTGATPDNLTTSETASPQ